MCHGLPFQLQSDEYGNRTPFVFRIKNMKYGVLFDVRVRNDGGNRLNEGETDCLHRITEQPDSGKPATCFDKAFREGERRTDPCRRALSVPCIPKRSPMGTFDRRYGSRPGRTRNARIKNRIRRTSRSCNAWNTKCTDRTPVRASRGRAAAFPVPRS